MLPCIYLPMFSNFRLVKSIIYYYRLQSSLNSLTDQMLNIYLTITKCRIYWDNNNKIKWITLPLDCDFVTKLCQCRLWVSKYLISPLKYNYFLSIWIFVYFVWRNVWFKRFKNLLIMTHFSYNVCVHIDSHLMLTRT